MPASGGAREKPPKPTSSADADKASSGLGAEALAAQQRGLLARQLVPKHPASLMSGPSAVYWLKLMSQAVDEALLHTPARPTSDDISSPSVTGERQLVLAEAVLRFCLHFLAFFDFTPFISGAAAAASSRGRVDAGASPRPSYRRQAVRIGPVKYFVAQTVH